MLITFPIKKSSSLPVTYNSMSDIQKAEATQVRSVPKKKRRKDY
jgi:hypothetical protein